MLRKLSRLTVLLLTVSLLCFLLSPAALAVDNKSTCGTNSYACYQKSLQTLLQNVSTCQKNNALATQSCKQSTNYKITQTCPQPKQTNCSQNTAGKTTQSCSQTTQTQSGSQNTTCSQTQSVKPAQTAKPSQTTPAIQPSQPAASVKPAASNYVAEVVRLVNVERAKYNLAPLTMDSQLSAAAQVRAKEANIKFSHTRPNGSSCFSVLKELGISYRRAGENIAIGQNSPAQVVKAWMDSPGHRANILGDYSKIGVGVQEAGGNFRGYSWAQFFTK